MFSPSLHLHPGNIAAEDFEFRQTLIANGVVRPLAQLLVGARKALDNNGGWLVDGWVGGGGCRGAGRAGCLSEWGGQRVGRAVGSAGGGALLGVLQEAVQRV